MEMPHKVEDEICRSNLDLETGCLIHPNHRKCIKIEGSPTRIKQLVYERFKGKSQHQIRSICGNPACINPNHLRALSTEELFWRMVDRREDDECWEYLGSRTSFGYGTHGAHVRAFVYANGFQPSVVMHSCDNPPCCNPKHLLAGTHQRNVADKVSKKRHGYGETAGTAVLSEQDVLSIRERRRRGEKQTAIWKDYRQVSYVTISDVIRRKSWRHI